MKKIFLFLCTVTFLPFLVAGQPVKIKATVISHQLFIHICLNTAPGDTLNFIFDSGAGTTLLDAATATRLKIPVSNGGQVSGASGSMAIQTAGRLSFLIGSLKLDNINTVVTDLERLSATTGMRIDGIIGYDILKNYPVGINIDNQQLTIYTLRAQLPAEKGTLVDFTFSPQLSFLPLIKGSFTLANKKTFEGPFFMDSGAGLTTLINTPFAKAQGLDNLSQPVMQLPSESLTSASTRFVTRGSSFSFNNFTFPDVPIHIAYTTAGVSAMTGVAGILGNEFLFRFNLLLDYPGKLIFMTPNHHFNDKFEMPLCSFSLKYAEGKLLIAHISPGSPEAIAGMQENDEVVAIDGKTDIKLTEARALLKQDGKTINLTLFHNGKKNNVAVKLSPRI